MRQISLSEFGLETVAEVCARKGWAAKTVQNWINADLIPAVVIGAGRSARFLVRTTDVDAFSPPPRGPKPGNRNAAKEPRPEGRPAAAPGKGKRRGKRK